MFMINSIHDYPRKWIDYIIHALHRTNFIDIQWDRVVPTKNGITIYGWINNYNKSDFVLIDIDFDNDGNHYIVYHSSSAKFSSKIAEVSDLQHTSCVRFDDFFDMEVR